MINNGRKGRIFQVVQVEQALTDKPHPDFSFHPFVFWWIYLVRTKYYVSDALTQRTLSHDLRIEINNRYEYVFHKKEFHVPLSDLSALA